MSQFSIHAVANGPQCDLVLSGEVDLQVTDELMQVAHTHLSGKDVQCLLIDLRAVTFMDSTGLSALVAIRNVAKQQGKETVLANVPERIARLIGITGLDRVFAINSPSAAIAKDSDAPTERRLRIVPS